MSASSKSDWSGIINAIKNPLAFFALALLTVEALIAILSVNGASIILWLSLLGTAMFVFVVVMVVLLLVKSPEVLLATKVSDLRRKLEKAKADTKAIQMLNKLVQALQNPSQFLSAPIARNPRSVRKK